LTTAYNIAVPPTVVRRELFQLVGPEDYTQDFLDDTQRRESCTLVRSVGAFAVYPFLSLGDPQDNNIVDWSLKAVLFTASDAAIADTFANDPGSFDIAYNPQTFVDFNRRYQVMQTFWFRRGTYGATGALTAAGDIWIPPDAPNRESWDVTVKRKLTTDEALWLLINCDFLQSIPTEFGGSIDVESRALIHD